MKYIIPILAAAIIMVFMPACAQPVAEVIEEPPVAEEPAVEEPEVAEEPEPPEEPPAVEEEAVSDSFNFESKGIEVTISEITHGISDKNEPYVIATFEVTNHNDYDYKPRLVSTYLQLEDGTVSDGSGFNGDTDLDFATQNFEANSTKTGILAWHFKDVENIDPGRADVIDFAFTEEKPEEEKDGPFVSSAKFEDMYFEFR